MLVFFLFWINSYTLMQTYEKTCVQIDASICLIYLLRNGLWLAYEFVHVRSDLVSKR